LEKYIESRFSYLFTYLYFLSSDFFFSDFFFSNLSFLSVSALLFFSSLHIVGSLTSKFPLIKLFYLNLFYIYFLRFLILFYSLLILSILHWCFIIYFFQKFIPKLEFDIEIRKIWFWFFWKKIKENNFILFCLFNIFYI
jgi:hypothetical protein